MRSDKNCVMAGEKLLLSEELNNKKGKSKIKSWKIYL